ncbi:hypothetical protein LEMLEM_LOCUS17563 [Lemmus lemmus]
MDLAGTSPWTPGIPSRAIESSFGDRWKYRQRLSSEQRTELPRSS